MIRAHNNSGSFEIYQYGLEPDKLTGTISYNGGSYDYQGFGITQEAFDPLKDYYNPIHEVFGAPLTKEQGQMTVAIIWPVKRMKSRSAIIMLPYRSRPESQKTSGLR